VLLLHRHLEHADLLAGIHAVLSVQAYDDRLGKASP